LANYNGISVKYIQHYHLINKTLVLHYCIITMNIRRINNVWPQQVLPKIIPTVKLFGPWSFHTCILFQWSRVLLIR